MDRATLTALPAMLAAMALIPAGDTAGKLLTTAGVAPVFVAWSRFALGAVLALPVLGPGRTCATFWTGVSGCAGRWSRAASCRS